MLFTIQAYVEDYLNRRNLADSDGYAVRLANLYFHSRGSLSDSQLQSKAHRIRTVVFVNNSVSDRSGFESALIDRLNAQFAGKFNGGNPSFPGGTEKERRLLRGLPRRSITALVEQFKSAVESRAIDAFWLSRKNGSIRQRPEIIAQGLFAVFAKGVLGDKGIILREFASGIGFVDIGVIFTSTLHLVELKMLNDGLVGPAQLEQYMKNEGRSKGTLLLIDARSADRKALIPPTITVSAGDISVLSVDINPPVPSALK